MGKAVSTVVVDSRYGTIENLLACFDRGIKAHMPDLRRFASIEGPSDYSPDFEARAIMACFLFFKKPDAA